MTHIRKPGPGLWLNVWRICLHLNFARSGTWANNQNGTLRTELLAICLVQKEGLSAVSVVIGPVKIMGGLAQ